MNELLVVKDNGVIEISEQAIEEYRKNQYILTVAKMQQDIFKEELQEAMEKYGVKKIEMSGFSATVVPESTYKRFNSRKFKKENPELHKQYQTEAKRKGYVRIEVDEG